LRKLLLAIGLVLLTIGPSQADSLGIDFTGYSNLSNYSIWSLGWQFSVSSNITVSALGAYDYGQNGFPRPQQVGLWTNNGTLLASTYVDDSDSLTGSWRFHSITPVTLTPGDYRVASQGGEGFVNTITGAATAPGVTYIQDWYHYTGSTANNPLYFPDGTNNFNTLDTAGYFGGNFMTSNAPVPGTLLLLGSGFLSLASWRRIKKS
jgi:hypothetical protein